MRGVKSVAGQVHSFFLVILIFLYGLKYSTVYPATNHINPANSPVAIHFSNVTIFTPLCVLVSQ